MLRVSYARTLESPFNENLVLASEGCNYAVISDLSLLCKRPTHLAIAMSSMRACSRRSGAMQS